MIYRGLLRHIYDVLIDCIIVAIDSTFFNPNINFDFKHGPPILDKTPNFVRVYVSSCVIKTFYLHVRIAGVRLL